MRVNRRQCIASGGERLLAAAGAALTVTAIVTSTLGLAGYQKGKTEPTPGTLLAQRTVMSTPVDESSLSRQADAHSPSRASVLQLVRSIDWGKLQPEILTHFQNLVRIDSRAGNETKVADYLRTVLEAEGISTKTFAKDPARANLVARLKGNGTKRPLLLLAHSDVVDVQPEKWPVGPFSAEVKDGYVWGRGAVDDKPLLTANLMVMLLLKRHNVPLDRDVIFLAESAEEADSTGVGITFMVNEHYSEIDAEFSLTEADKGATIENGKVTRMDIGVAEKFPARVKLVARGPSGHGSIPRADNAVAHLAKAVAKLSEWEPPMQLLDVTRALFTKLAPISPPDVASVYRGLLDPASSEAARSKLRDTDPRTYALLQHTVVPTMLKAGVGINVVPSEAEATLDIRMLPGADVPAFYRQLAKVVDDPSVKVEPLPPPRPPSPASRIDTEFFEILEEVSQEMYPGAPVLPSMSAGSSDKAQLRAKGQQAYGIAPPATEEERLNHWSHSDVERVRETSVYSLAEYVFKVTQRLAAGGPSQADRKH